MTSISDAALRILGIAVFTLFWTSTHASNNPIYSENCSRVSHCSLSKLLSKDLVGSSAKGSLFKLLLLGGESTERNRRKIIKWNRQPHTVYVFCSKTLPAVVMRRNDDTLQTTFLEIGSGIPMVLISDFQIYARTCHDLSDTHDDAEVAKRFGYDPDASAFDRLEKEMREPSDLLGF